MTARRVWRAQEKWLCPACGGSVTPKQWKNCVFNGSVTRTIDLRGGDDWRDCQYAESDKRLCPTLKQMAGANGGYGEAWRRKMRGIK